MNIKYSTGTINHIAMQYFKRKNKNILYIKWDDTLYKYFIRQELRQRKFSLGIKNKVFSVYFTSISYTSTNDYFCLKYLEAKKQIGTI